ncbi:MAG TPA: hypothetical protein VNY78_00945 [Edaphobacter sp.]|nr:hypothetical protein [Edaphobacter sp.]
MIGLLDKNQFSPSKWHKRNQEDELSLVLHGTLRTEGQRCHAFSFRSLSPNEMQPESPRHFIRRGPYTGQPTHPALTPT